MADVSKILFLGPEDSPLFIWLKEQNENIIQTSHRITMDFIQVHKITFLLSYGYRYIISKEILDRFPDHAINLHISYLPWNRGADPNLWSFVEGTPKGVSIHYLDPGVDTGDIIVQREIAFSADGETLASTYEKLQSAIQQLFKETWQEIKSSRSQRKKQNRIGSFHKMKDKESISHLLTQGWHTPVSVLDDYAADLQMSLQFWEKYDRELEELSSPERGSPEHCLT